MAANTFEVEIGQAKLVEELGKGSYATVYLVEKEDGRLIVIKCFNLINDKNPKELKESFLREKAVLENDHIKNSPYIVHLYGSSSDEEKCFLGMEHYTEGDLTNFIEKYGRPTPIQRMFFADDIIRGLVILHEKAGFVHGDLNPANILVTRYSDKGETFFRAVIADFGLAFERNCESETFKKKLPNPALYPTVKFKSYEKEKKVDPAWPDMFCIGSLLVVLIERKFNIPDMERISELLLMQGDYIQQMNDHYLKNKRVETEYIKLISACWNPKVSKIPKAGLVSMFLQNSSVFQSAFKKALDPDSLIFEKHILPIANDFYSVLSGLSIEGLTEKLLPIYEKYSTPIEKMKAVYKIVDGYMKSAKNSSQDKMIETLLNGFIRLFEKPNFNAINHLEEALRNVNGITLSLRAR